METLVVLDFACEAVVRLALSHLRVQVARGDYFQSLVEKLEKTLGPGRLHGTGPAMTLHGARTAALHDLRGPDDEYAAEVGAVARVFVASVVQEVWKLDIASIKQSEIIHDPRLRELVGAAEDGIESNDLRQGLIGLALAAGELRMRLSFRDEHRPFGSWRYELPRLVSDSVSVVSRSSLRRVESSLGDLGAALDQILAELDAVGAGLSGKEYRWFRSLIPTASFNLSGGGWLMVPDVLPSVGELRRALQLLLGWIEQSEPLPTEPERRTIGSGPAVSSVRFTKSWPAEGDAIE